jgi:hypothetical protein
MKKVLITAILMMGIFALNAQELTDKNVKKNGPEIKFKTTLHEYGEIYLNGDGTYKFEFTNTGNEPLILSKPRSSCGCTVPSWPKEPILPGETNNIKVTYNTHKAGAFNKTVTVYSNSKTVVLRIKGKVIAEPTEALPAKPTTMGAAPINKKK